MLGHLAHHSMYKLLLITLRFPKPKDAPVSNEYRPELDESEELDEVDAAYYQSLIGVLRWIVELGRVDINCEVSMMSSCLALPRFGHLHYSKYSIYLLILRSTTILK